MIVNNYDAGGRKLRSKYFTLIDHVNIPVGGICPWSEYWDPEYGEWRDIVYTSTSYVGNHEYLESFDQIYDRRIHNVEGYALRTSHGDYQYHYYRRDHLGNNREVWRAPYSSGSTNYAASTVQRTQYYPSGLPWKSNSGDNPGEQPYKYGAKEFVEMHGLDEYDSEARWYYPAIMRTTTMDPHCEKYYSISPYAWCENNPVRMVDPDGRDPRKFKDWITFGQSVFNATTAVITFGLQGSAKVNVGSFALGVSSNPGSFDLIGIRDGNFTPNKNTPTIQSGSEVSLGVFSLSTNTTITDNGSTTTKTESTSGGITVLEGVHKTTTEINQKTNEVINTDTQSGVKISDVGAKASFIFGFEIKVDMKKVEEALRKLINE